jgi:hypothetical protein
MLTGAFQEILGHPAKESDQRYDGYLAQLRTGSLILFDLGYVALARLQQLIRRRIYFIGRWNPRFEALTTGRGVRPTAVTDRRLSRAGYGA